MAQLSGQHADTMPEDIIRPLLVAAILATGPACVAQTRDITPPQQSEVRMHHASGNFQIKLTPQPLAPSIEAAKFGRQLIDKRFDGELSATSLGEMLSAGTPTQGAAGYVALERVTGMLGGRHGSFVLMHCGTIDHGATQLSITVVPGSGTDELVGLSGSMAIHIGNDGSHTYTFDYQLP